MESDSMEVGPNRRMRDALSAKGELGGYSEYDGGHSFLNWSGGMVRGLEFLTNGTVLAATNQRSQRKR